MASERYGLLESLNHEWIKLVHDAMRTTGSAAQTLGGVLAITSKETFVSVEAIARKSRLPSRTVQIHLRRLEEHGFIRNMGRGQTRAGRRRRTNTIAVAQHLREATYGILPWWATGPIAQHGMMPWAARAVLAVVTARLAATVRAAQYYADEQGLPVDEDGIDDVLEELGGDDRFVFSVRDLQHQTGLSTRAIASAKRWLHGARIVDWRGRVGPRGETLPDILAPNYRFRVVITPTSETHCRVSFSYARRRK